MHRYWGIALLALGSREGALHGKGTSLCSVPGKKVNQKSVVASSVYLLAAQPSRDPAFPSSSSVTQAGALGLLGSPQTCPPVLLRGSAVKSSFPRQLAVVPQTRDCSFTAGRGSSIGQGGGGGREGEGDGSHSAGARSVREAAGQRRQVRSPAGASPWRSLGGSRCHMCLVLSIWVTPLGFGL